MKNYYLLQLTNSKRNHYNIEIRSDKYFDIVSTIGEEIDGEMYDLLTGMKILEVDETTVLPFLTYYKKEKASPNQLTFLRNKIKKNEVIYELYVEELNRILQTNIKEYEEFEISERELKELRMKKNERIL